MIELTFRTADGPMVIQFSSPVPTPGGNRPWAIEVRLHGRPSTIVGEDPLEALALGALFAASYLGGREGLEPALNELPWKQTPDLLAQGFREGLLAVLDVRGSRFGKSPPDRGVPAVGPSSTCFRCRRAKK